MLDFGGNLLVFLIYCRVIFLLTSCLHSRARLSADSLLLVFVSDV